jgi:hypothetical protein
MAVQQQIDDQPISAGFFGEGKWLTEFVIPESLEVQTLHDSIVSSLPNPDSLEDRIHGLWSWVANEVKYTKFVKGKIWVGGRSSIQDDFWATPGITARIKVGNCATKSFLLGSLLRNELPAERVHVVLGNLYNGKPGGHAWIQLDQFIMETTRPDVPPMVPVSSTERYEAVHLFNDKDVRSIEGRTVLVPFTACYSSWLKDYLDWAYIEGRK